MTKDLHHPSFIKNVSVLVKKWGNIAFWQALDIRKTLYRIFFYLFTNTYTLTTDKKTIFIS